LEGNKSVSREGKQVAKGLKGGRFDRPGNLGGKISFIQKLAKEPEGESE